jgi:hypothetical protein
MPTDLLAAATPMAAGEGGRGAVEAVAEAMAVEEVIGKNRLACADWEPKQKV